MSKFLNAISVFVWCAGRDRGCWILDAGSAGVVGGAVSACSDTGYWILDIGFWILDAGSAAVVVTTAANFEAYENESGNKLPHSKGEAVVLPNRVSSIQYRASSIQYRASSIPHPGQKRPPHTPTDCSSSIEHPASHSPPPPRTTPAFQAQTYLLRCFQAC